MSNADKLRKFTNAQKRTWRILSPILFVGGFVIIIWDAVRAFWSEFRSGARYHLREMREMWRASKPTKGK
jgi:hypothetical protein